jgi:voltage-gated potassium channel Kch
MSKPTFAERSRYWFDNWMSRGLVALIALLGVATAVFVLILGSVAALLLNLSGEKTGEEASIGELLWGSLMRTLDPGTMGGDEGWWTRILMLLVTIGGLIIVASLIGIVSGAFDGKVEELRKGRSRVLENDHTLILGWSPKVFSIISELVIANESRRSSAIVVVADRDKIEMEEEIRGEVGKTGKTRVICRSGDPMNLNELELGSPHTARSVVIIAPEGSDDPDSVVIKTALALTNNPNRRSDAYHIVGELRDPENLEAARLVGRDEAHWVLAGDLISRITVQTCRQSGLSVVYSELLDFGGDEIYFTEQPTLVGQSYSDTQSAFADSSVMGMVKAGAVLLNPPADTVYEAGDRLVVIAEDDDAIKLAARGSADESVIPALAAVPVVPERTLVLGYNSGLPAILRELHEYVPAGSTATIVADIPDPALPSFSDFTVRFQRGDTTSRAVLDRLDVQLADHIIVLADKESPVQRADAKTLITLLHLRDISERADVDLNVVSEMLDDRNRELAEVTNADDFIVSDKLVSLMLTQVSENKQLTDVFANLFSSEGAEVYLRPAEFYVTSGTEVDFYTVLEAARRRGETAIGRRVAAHEHSGAHAYGVVVNPTKTDRFTFAPGDRVIVLAED